MFCRLTPPYAIMILIMSTIILNMGDGPLWYSTVEPEVEVCHKSWWSGILYVQSFVEPNSNVRKFKVHRYELERDEA